MKITQQHFLQIGIVGFLLTIVYLYGVTIVHGAGEYTPLVGIPGVPTSGAAGLPEFFNRVYLLTISLGALFGILKIAYAGVKYSTTDVLSSKQSAKEDIKGVLLGLAILLLPALVLQTINPKLTNLDILSAATKINLDKSAGTGVGTGGVVAQHTTAYPSGTAFDKTNYHMTCEQQQCDAVEDYTVSQSSVDEAKTACAAKNGTFTDNGTTGNCFFKASDDGGPTTSYCHVGNALKKNI